MTWLMVLAFAKEHWQKLGWFAPVFFLAMLKGCADNASLSAKLAACESKPPVIQTVEAKAHQTVQVVYRDGSPCPDVTATNETEAHATTAQAESKPCPTAPDFGLWIGGGYLGTPFVSAGAQWKSIQVNVKRGPLEWGGEAQYRLLAF